MTTSSTIDAPPALGGAPAAAVDADPRRRVARAHGGCEGAGDSSMAGDVTSLVFTLLGVAVLVGHPVPKSNEWTYLVLLKQQWNPDWIAGDWSLATPDLQHYVFNVLFGWTTCLLPLEVVAWSGRVGCWAGVLVFLFRIGDRLGVRRWATSAAILAWVALGQSLVAYEWVLGGFEAKCVAYVLLFASIDGFVRGGRTWPAVALGCCFSLHPAVGLWGGLALGGALLIERPHARELARLAGVVVAFSLPGALPLLLSGASSPSLEQAEFFVRSWVPFHVDPSWFDRGLVAAGLVMLVFNLRVAWLLRAEIGWRLLAWMQLFAAAEFGFGIGARLLERWDWMAMMPFRFFPLLVLLVFFWTLFHVVDRRRELRLGTPTVLLGVLAVACLPNPVTAVRQRLVGTIETWSSRRGDDARAFAWIARNTPKNAVIVAAPNWNPPWIHAERPLIAAWSYRPTGHESEWRDRMEALCGDDLTLSDYETFRAVMQRRFDHRTEEEILETTRRYGGNYLVGRGDYSFPIVHEVGAYRVYELPQPSSKELSIAGGHPSNLASAE